MLEADLTALTHTVAWASFAIAFVLGAVMNRTNFCTMGAVSDIVNMSEWTRMRMWICAIAVAIIGTQTLAAIGWVDLTQSFYTQPTLSWLSHLIGGLAFGFGMVLASGCGSKTLVRVGAGSLKSLIVFIVLGLFAYMTLRGVFGVWRTRHIDTVTLSLVAGQDLPRLIAANQPAALAASLATTRWVLGLGIGGALLAWCLTKREFRNFDSLLGGLTVGLAIVAIWFVSGHVGFVAEHPKTLEAAWLATNSGRPESLSFVAPIAYTLELLMLWSDKSRIVTVGIASTLGMIAGSAAYALASKQFRWEGFRTTEDTANHLVGAALMGVGGVTALGCTIGQGLSGLSTLALGSLISFVAIIAGAVLAMRYQTWRIEYAN
jgi:uncharacterized protein